MFDAHDLRKMNEKVEFVTVTMKNVRHTVSNQKEISYLVAHMFVCNEFYKFPLICRKLEIDYEQLPAIMNITLTQQDIEKIRFWKKNDLRFRHRLLSGHGQNIADESYKRVFNAFIQQIETTIVSPPDFAYMLDKALPLDSGLL